MAQEAGTVAGAGDKLVIRNIGLLLSGDIGRPILDADTLIAVDGRIAAIGRARDLDTSGATTTIDAKGTTLAPGLIDSHVHPVAGDWTPRQNQLGWIDSSLNGGVTTMISAGEVHTPGRPRDIVGVKAMAITAQRTFSAFRAARREGACRRALHRAGHGGAAISRSSPRPASSCSARSGSAASRTAPTARKMVAWARKYGIPVDHPHRRAIDPGLRPDRQGRRAGGGHRRHRPYQWRPHGAAGRPDPLHLRGLRARPRAGP